MASRRVRPKFQIAPIRFDFDDFKTTASQDYITTAIPEGRKTTYTNTLENLEEAIIKKDFICFKINVSTFESLLDNCRNVEWNTIKTKFEKMKHIIYYVENASNNFTDPFKYIQLHDSSSASSALEFEKNDRGQLAITRMTQIKAWTAILGRQVTERSFNEIELKYTLENSKCDEMDSILHDLQNALTVLKDQNDKRKSDDEVTRKTKELLGLIRADFKPTDTKKKPSDPQYLQPQAIGECISEVNEMIENLSSVFNAMGAASRVVDYSGIQLFSDRVTSKTFRRERRKKTKNSGQHETGIKSQINSLRMYLDELTETCNRNDEIVKETNKEIEDLTDDIINWTAFTSINEFDKDKTGALVALRSARIHLQERKRQQDEKSSEKRVKKLRKLCVESGVPEPTVKEKNEMAIVELLEQHLKQERDSLKSVEKELVELQEDKNKYKATKEKTDVNTLLQMANDAKANLQKYKREHQSHQTNLGRLQTMIEDLCKTHDISDATDKDDRYVNMIQALFKRLKKEKSALEEGLSQLQAKDDNKGSTVSNDDRSGIERLIEIAQTAKKDVAQLQRYYKEEKESVKKYEDNIRKLSEEIEPEMQEIIDTIKDKNYADLEKHQRNQGNDKQKNKDDQDPFVRIRAKIEVMKWYSEEVMSTLAYTSEMILSLEPTQQNKPGGRRSMIRYINVLLDKVTKNEITWGNVSFLNGEIEKMNAGLAKWKERAIQEENEKKDYMTRLSKIASAKLPNDNPNIADLSDPNRQTKLAEEYSQLYDNEWTNAFEDVEKKPDLNPIDYLRDILTTVYDDCAEIRRLQIKKIKISILQPAKLLTEISKPPSPEADKDESAKQKSKQETKEKPNRPLPPTPGPGGQTKELALGELQSKAISEVVKQSYTDALLDINRYFSSSYEAYFTTPHLKAYTTKCIELCWLMNIHSPPVCLGPIVQKGAKFDKIIYREYTARGKQVEFVVWPAILLHEKGPLLGKGVAQGIK